MAGIKMQHRDFDFFVSYRHTALARVAPMVTWLTTVCGLKISFDAIDGNAASRSSEYLAGAIGNARGALIFLSEEWRASSWCKNEYEAVLNQQQMQDGFEVVKLRLDDVEPPEWFNVSELIDLRQDNAHARARLLGSLCSAVPRKFDNAQDVYLASPWSKPSVLARETFRALGDTGWRLVGDSRDNKEQREMRIQSIMKTTRGVVALLPHDPTQSSGNTSPHILAEAQLALDCGKPLLLLAEPGVAPPPTLTHAAFRGTALTLEPGSSGRAALHDALEAFDDQIDHLPHDDTRAFIFLAGSLRGDRDVERDLEQVIERASNLRCVRGERVAPGSGTVQQAIVDLIRRAALVIADVSDDHRNTLIETGIAMGAGTKLRLMVSAPGGVLPSRRFMFDGQEVLGYASPEQRLGLCYFIARNIRRQVYVVR